MTQEVLESGEGGKRTIKAEKLHTVCGYDC